jgi:hypothetical protein
MVLLVGNGEYTRPSLLLLGVLGSGNGQEDSEREKIRMNNAD